MLLVASDAVGRQRSSVSQLARDVTAELTGLRENLTVGTDNDSQGDLTILADHPDGPLVCRIDDVAEDTSDGRPIRLTGTEQFVRLAHTCRELISPTSRARAAIAMVLDFTGVRIVDIQSSRDPSSTRNFRLCPSRSTLTCTRPPGRAAPHQANQFINRAHWTP